MVLTLDGEHTHDIVITTELALNYLTVDSDELLLLHLGLHWLLLLLSIQVLPSWPVA